MKTKFVLIVISVMLSVVGSISAGKVVKTNNFKVYGNCGMCENRIEKAANAVKGVSSSDWDRKSKIMTVKYDASKTSVTKIHEAIAKAGHDTDKQKAEDKVYEKLHTCCKYTRAEFK